MKTINHKNNNYMTIYKPVSITKLLTISTIVLLVISQTSFADNKNFMIKKMKEKISQQQDTIDLLTMKLNNNQGVSNGVPLGDESISYSDINTVGNETSTAERLKYTNPDQQAIDESWQKKDDSQFSIIYYP